MLEASSVTPGAGAPAGRPLRVAIAGIAIESSTFSPHRTGLEDFTVTRGAQLLGRYAWTSEPRPWCDGVEWVPLVHAVALPGGPVLPEVYQELTAEVLSRAQGAGHLDGLLLDVHGAMSVVGMSDVEAELAWAVRDVVGPDVLVSASMDLHGNVSRRLAQAVDLITCFRMAPHEDAWESRERAARNLVQRLRRGGRPAKAWVSVPVLLPGEKTSTRLEPAKGIYAMVAEVEALDGVLDAAVWVGYAWADEPRCRAAVVVTGDDVGLIREQAGRLARRYWDARDAFSFVAPTGSIEECIDKAVASAARPYFISDSGDNPTAGGAGDVSYTLGRLLASPQVVDGGLRWIYASIQDPAAVAVAVAAGVGGRVELELGAKVDSRPAPPVPLVGEVRSVRLDDAVAGTTVVVAVGGVDVIVTSRRKPYHRISDFTDLGLSPRAADVVVVKIGYLEPELYEVAADWCLALTPGGVDQDLLRLGYRNLDRPVFPLDPDAPEPDLAPELL